MAKKLSKNKGAVDKWRRLKLPPEITQLLRSKRRTERGPLHYANIACTTKWRAPTASRCIRNGLPQFRLLGISSNTSSASTGQQYFYGEYYIHNAATDCCQIRYFSKEKAWIKYECDTIDPFDPKKKRMEFTGVIGFQGKFYAMSLQGAVAVIESVESSLTITGISRNRGVPSESWKLFKEHLFEMNGELFLIFLIHEKSIEVVDRVEVFRLCFDGLKWVKIEGMQGKAVFLDRGCCWVYSGEIGCRGDCVYFTQGGCNGWWVYDMQSCCISVALMKY